MSESEQDYEFEEINEEQEVEEVEGEESQGETPEEEVSTYIDIDSIEDEKLRKQIDARIKKESREKHERERKYQEEIKAKEERLRKMEEELLTLKKPKEVQPPTPDDWYNDYDTAAKQQQAYMESQQAKLQYDQEQNQRSQRLEAEKKEQQLRREQKLFEGANKAGLDQNDFIRAATFVGNSGISQETAVYLMEHENGAQLINHLAKNPIEIQEIASLSPFQVGEKLNQMALKFKPNRKSKAPPPDEPIRSNSAVKEENPWLKGAKFE